MEEIEFMIELPDQEMIELPDREMIEKLDQETELPDQENVEIVETISEMENMVKIGLRDIYISRFCAQGERNSMQDYIGNDPYSIQYDKTYGKIMEMMETPSDVKQTLSDLMTAIIPTITTNGSSAFTDMSISSTNVEQVENYCHIDNTHVYSIFDGHGGKACARKCAESYNAFLMDRLSQVTDVNDDNYMAVIRNSFQAFNDAECSLHKSGATASIVVMCAKKIFVANIGDSTVVLLQKTLDASDIDVWKVLYVSPDHNTENPDEVERLQSQNIVLESVYGDVPRFSTGLAVTRAMGDSESEKYINREPAIFHMTIEDNDENEYWVIMASDGFWQVIDAQDTPLFLTRMSKNTKFSDLAFHLTRFALMNQTNDNVMLQILLSKFSK